MAETLILEFAPVEGRDAADLYRSVNGVLGIDADARTGEVPAGLIHHQGALLDSGGLLVIELWESRDAQAAFMETRLGPALGQAGVQPPVRVEWGGTMGVIEPW